jgi:hypothetical protein
MHSKTQASPERNIRRLRSELLQAGIAPRHVRRTISEIQDHMDDLVAARLASGCDLAAARRRACEEMGELASVVEAMRACPELQCWGYRYPRLALIVYPLSCLALLPIVPLFVGVAHARDVARWSACLLFAALVTASMFMSLQLAIALS